MNIHIVATIRPNTNMKPLFGTYLLSTTAHINLTIYKKLKHCEHHKSAISFCYHSIQWPTVATNSAVSSTHGTANTMKVLHTQCHAEHSCWVPARGRQWTTPGLKNTAPQSCLWCTATCCDHRLQQKNITSSRHQYIVNNVHGPYYKQYTQKNTPSWNAEIIQEQVFSKTN